MIGIMFYSLILIKISFLWVNEVVVLQIFQSLLNLFQTDGPKNEKLFYLSYLC